MLQSNLRYVIKMGDLILLLPQLPYEILNIILSFSEDGLIRAQIRCGEISYHIQWNMDPIFELEATILVRRIFPQYWYYDADPDEKYIYYFMKDYFKSVIRDRE